MLDERQIKDRMKGRTMGLARVGSVLVLAHNAKPPAEDEWAVYCDVISRNYASIRAQFIIAEGSGPDAAQRQQALDKFPSNVPIPPTAVLTRSAVVRGVVTLFNWFSPRSMKAFSPDDLASAARQLGIDEQQMKPLFEYAMSLKPD